MTRNAIAYNFHTHLTIHWVCMEAPCVFTTLINSVCLFNLSTDGVALQISKTNSIIANIHFLSTCVKLLFLLFLSSDILLWWFYNFPDSVCSLLHTWFYPCTVCLNCLNLEHSRGGLGAGGCSQCSAPTCRPFKSYISFYLHSASASGKVERQDERQRVRERGRDGGRAGKTRHTAGVLHNGRLRETWENEEVDI